MAVEWTATIEGRNGFGDTCRKGIRIDKSWESLFHGDIGLSIGDSKKIMPALQNAVVNHEPETYAFFAGFARIAIRSDRSRTTRHAGSEPSLAPLSLIPDLKEICPDRAIPELMELTARG